MPDEQQKSQYSHFTLKRLFDFLKKCLSTIKIPSCFSKKRKDNLNMSGKRDPVSSKDVGKKDVVNRGRFSFLSKMTCDEVMAYFSMPGLVR